jgi:hypothetical protein
MVSLGVLNAAFLRSAVSSSTPFIRTLASTTNQKLPSLIRSFRPSISLRQIPSFARNSVARQTGFLKHRFVVEKKRFTDVERQHEVLFFRSPAQIISIKAPVSPDVSWPPASYQPSHRQSADAVWSHKPPGR